MVDIQHATLCVRRRASSRRRSKLFNTNQDAQFTVDAFKAREHLPILGVSMDVRGHVLENAFCVCLWRSVKCENTCLNQHNTVFQLQTGLSDNFHFYNNRRPNQSLNFRTTTEEHFVL